MDSINSFVLERQTTLLQIFPVAVRAMNGTSEDVVAFLDDGSTGTLIIYPSLSVLKSAKNTKTTSTYNFKWQSTYFRLSHHIWSAHSSFERQQKIIVNSFQQHLK